MQVSDSDRLYFRQLLSGRDFAEGDGFAAQMRNFAYLIGDRQTGACLVVDPAYAAGDLLDAIEADGMHLSGVLVTHHHPDHMGGNDALKARFPKAKLVAPKSEVERIPGIDETVADGDRIAFGGLSFKVIEVPGHTRGHIALWTEQGGRHQQTTCKPPA